MRRKANNLDQDSDTIGSLEEEKPENEETESLEVLLGHYMASIGFRPKTPRDKDTLEFAKIYSDPSGKIARVVSVIKKDDLGLEPKYPEYFTLTIQLHVPAREEVIRKAAPAFARADMLRIVSHFDAPSDRTEMELVQCATCGATVAEYISDLASDDKVCFDCHKKQGGSNAS